MITVTKKSKPPVDTLDDIVLKSLKPDVQRIDHEGYYPESFMREYGAAGAYRPVSEDGNFYSAIENCARVGQICGSTAFSIWCHNTCLWYLTNTANTSLQDRYLEGIANGSQLGATGLSNPVKSFFGIEKMKLKGERTSTGYRIKGTLPWVSNLLEEHVFGGIFEAEDGPVMALFDCSRSDIRLKPSGPFIALEGTATQAVGFLDAEISDDMILAADAKAACDAHPQLQLLVLPTTTDTTPSNEALRSLRRSLLALNRHGVAAAAAFADTITPQYVSDLLAYACVPASSAMCELVSGLSMPAAAPSETPATSRTPSTLHPPAPPSPVAPLPLSLTTLGTHP